MLQSGPMAALALGLISAASLLLVLTLTRLFAVQQFYHFAFMAVSVGLLGNAASGSLLSVTGRRPRPSLLAAGFALSTGGATLLLNYLPFDSFTIAREPRQVLYLALYFLAAAAPFTFSGLIVGSALEAAGQRSHRAYAVNLAGSAAGGLGAIPALAAFGSEGTVMLAAALGFAAAGLYGLAEGAFPSEYSVLPVPRRPTRSAIRSTLHATRTALPYLIPALLALYFAARPPAFLVQRLSPYKALSIYRLAPDARLALTRQDAAARVDVIESSSIHSLPGLGLTAAIAAPPPQAGLLVDGDNLMPITGLDPDSAAARALADHLPQSLAFRLRPAARTLILAPGGGFDVLAALAAGAGPVTVVEQNRLILEIVRDDYRSFTGRLYTRPEVRLAQQSSRSFARRPPEKYDVALLALTDPYRPVTSGAYSLSENYLYTVQAFEDYLDALSPGGLLVFNRWLQVPPSEEVRAFATLAEALRRSGREPVPAYLLAFRSMRTATFIAGERPFTTEEVALARSFLEQRGLDPILLPDVAAEETNRFNVLAGPIYYDAFRALLADPGRFLAENPFDVRPPTDDRPFFFHYFRWRQTPEILATLGLTWQPFGGSGYFVLLALLLLLTLASAALIFGPLLLRRGRERIAAPPGLRRRALLYFLCLGTGYLLVEIALAQKLILLLDQPVLALAAVIFALLTFSGIGSLTAPRWPPPAPPGTCVRGRCASGAGVRPALLLLAGLIVLYPSGIGWLERAALGWPSGLRLLAVCLSLAPLGLLMGVPFARGLAALHQVAPDLVPWAWAVNGSASVIAPVLGVMVALAGGFSAVLLLGAAAYAVALGAAFT